MGRLTGVLAVVFPCITGCGDESPAPATPELLRFECPDAATAGELLGEAVDVVFQAGLQDEISFAAAEARVQVLPAEDPPSDAATAAIAEIDERATALTCAPI